MNSGNSLEITDCNSWNAHWKHLIPYVRICCISTSNVLWNDFYSPNNGPITIQISMDAVIGI